MKKTLIVFIAGIFTLCSCEKEDNSTAEWERVTSSVMDDKSILSIAFSGTNMFAVVDSYGKGNLYSSTDNGANWTAITQIPYKVISTTIFGNYIFAGTVYGIYRSADNGASWTAVNTGIPFIMYTGLAEYNVHVCGTRLFVQYEGSFYSTTNNGDSWACISNNLDIPIRSITVSENYTIACTWKGIYRSNDNGVNWSAAITDNKYVETLANTSTNVIAGATNGFYYSTDNAANWTKANITDDTYQPWVECFFVSGKNVYAGVQSKGVYYSSDYGISWTTFNVGFDIEKHSKHIITLAVSGSYLYAGTSYDGIWRRPI